MGCPLSPEMASKTCARSSPMSVLPAADRPPRRRNSPPCGAHRMLTVMAEFEREMISERTVAGMQAAKRRGRYVGRPPKLTPHKIDHARQLIADGKETQAGAAALLGVGVATLRRALNGKRDG